MIDSVFWTVDDALAGTCSMSDVGSRKATEQVIEESPADPDLTASAQLKRDAMLAYKALGGPEYLRRNPELLDKTLLKMVAEPAQKVDGVVRLEIIAPWMDGQKRLAYQREPEYLKLVAGATDVTPIETAPPNRPDEIAQARAEHDAAQIKARDKDKATKARRAGTASYQRPEPRHADAIPGRMIDADPPVPGTARAVESAIAARAAKAALDAKRKS